MEELHGFNFSDYTVQNMLNRRMGLILEMERLLLAQIFSLLLRSRQSQFVAGDNSSSIVILNIQDGCKNRPNPRIQMIVFQEMAIT
ncbi:hypothetical protein ANCCAN_15120 [Ancylostoma caninum]|uniref:Uncharacterized protein n=1 Tax=Ancylostoma caninum TaxID=29170 RepID=A0A368G7I2_ANCCA|nr:hypothetical protein ANCCAN_15120 [Ancylostoma caninum]